MVRLCTSRRRAVRYRLSPKAVEAFWQVTTMQADLTRAHRSVRPLNETVNIF